MSTGFSLSPYYYQPNSVRTETIFLLCFVSLMFSFVFGACTERSECVVKVLVFLCGLRVLGGEWVWLWLCPAVVKGAFSVPYKNSQFQSLSISVDQSKSVASVLRVLVAAQLLSTKFFSC